MLLADGTATLAVKIVDVSVSGVGLQMRTVAPVEIGTRVEIGRRTGKVVRHFNGGPAVEFQRLIPIEEFDEDIVFRPQSSIFFSPAPNFSHAPHRRRPIMAGRRWPFSSSVAGPCWRADDQRIVGKLLPSVTSAFAPTRQFLIFAPLRMVAPMPISAPSPTMQPCRMTLWPIVALAPTSGNPGSV